MKPISGQRCLPWVFLLTSACYDNTAEPTTVVHPTLVGVSPTDFLGDVPCLAAQGAMQTYLATVFDVTQDLEPTPFELPSSSLVSCQQDVTFAFVVPGHRYTAIVQGYDRADLKKQAPGSRHAVNASGQVVPPRWTTECGARVDSTPTGAGGEAGATEQGAGGEAGAPGPAPGFAVRGVTSSLQYTAFTNYCLPLTDHGPPTDTRISVGLQAALRDLACGPTAGEVDEFSAELEGSGEPALRTACDENLVFAGLEAGQSYRFHILAYERGAPAARWETSCRTKALAGTVTPASCDPLVERL